MNKEEFDDWFDRAFEESVKNHEFVPDAGASWERVRKQLEKRAKRRRQLRTLPYVAASFILGALIFGTPTATDAFKPLFQAYSTVVEGVNKIVFGSQQQSDTVPLTSPPPDFEGGAAEPQKSSDGSSDDSSVQVSESSENSDLAFKIPSIPYIPEEFTLNYVETTEVTPGEKKHSRIFFGYTRSDGMALSVTVMKLPPGAIHSSGGSSEGVTIKPLTVHGFEAFLYLADDGWSTLEYMQNDLYVKISGPINEETIIRIADEMEIHE